jgi:Flp pilus assembly protein TadD
MRTRFCIIAAVIVSIGACASGPPAGERGRRMSAEKRRAAALVEQGAYADALRLLEPLATAASADPQVFVLLGDAHRGLGDVEGAITSYEQAIRLAYEAHEAHLKLATLLMEQGRTGRALTEFEVASRVGDRDTLVHYNYGLALIELDRREAAVGELRRACEMAPTNATFAQALGMALSGVDDDEALVAFERAELLGASDASFQNNYGLALERVHRCASARRRFEAAVATQPSNEAFRFNLAASITRADAAGREARDAWEGMRRDFGDRWSYRVYLCRALAAAGRHAEAVAVLESATLDRDAGRIAADSSFVDRTPPTVADAMEALALAHRRGGALRAALERIERAVALEPHNPSFLNNYGVLLADSDRIAEAQVQWKKVLEVDPENATARDNLSRFGP